MKTLKEYLNESLNEATKYFKEFKNVKKGDKGEDYNGEKGTVTIMGTAEEIAKKDPNGMMSDLIKDKTIDAKQDAVLVTMDEGETVAYVYGDDGFQCYK